MTDVMTGGLLLAATGVFFTYYTVWVIILPFVDKDQVYIHSLFPEQHYAIGLPLLAGVIGLLVIGIYLAVVFLNVKRKEKVQ